MSLSASDFLSSKETCRICEARPTHCVSTDSPITTEEPRTCYMKDGSEWTVDVHGILRHKETNPGFVVGALARQFFDTAVSKGKQVGTYVGSVLKHAWTVVDTKISAFQLFPLAQAAEVDEENDMYVEDAPPSMPEYEPRFAVRQFIAIDPEGKLTKERIENLQLAAGDAAKLFQKYGQEHPERAKALAMGGAFVASAFIGGGAGATLAMLAEAGAETIAVEAVLGAAAGLRTKVVSLLVEEKIRQTPGLAPYLHTVAQNVIHELTPYVQKVFPTYHKEEIEAHIAGGFATAVDVLEYMPAGIGTSLKAGSCLSATVGTLTQTACTPGKVFHSSLHHVRHRVLHTAAEGAREIPNTSFGSSQTTSRSSAYENFSGVKGNYYAQILAHMQTTSTEFVMTKGKVLVEEGAATMKRLSKVPHNPDGSLPIQEWKTIVNEEQTRINFHEIGNGFGCAAYVATIGAVIGGNARLANQLFVIGQNAPQLWTSIGEIISGPSAVSVASAAGSGASAGSAGGPWGAALGAAASIALSFINGGQENHLVEALNQWGQALWNQNNQNTQLLLNQNNHNTQFLSNQMTAQNQALSDQMSKNMKAMGLWVGDLYLHLMEAHVKEGKQISVLDDHVIRGFIALGQQNYESMSFHVYSVKETMRHLQAIHALKAEVDLLLFQKPHAASLAVERRQKRYVNQIGWKEFNSLVVDLENMLLEDDSFWVHFNGCIFGHAPPATRNQIMKSAPPEAHLGYWGQLLGLPEDKASALPNLEMFVPILERYIDLRYMGQHLPYDIKAELIKEVIEKIKGPIDFLRALETNKELFEKILTEYVSDFKIVWDEAKKLLAKRSETLLDTAHGIAMDTLRQEINLFPAYQELSPPSPPPAFPALLVPGTPRPVPMPPPPPPFNLCDHGQDERYCGGHEDWWGVTAHDYWDGEWVSPGISFHSRQEIWDFLLKYNPEFRMSEIMGGHRMTVALRQHVENYKREWEESERRRCEEQKQHNSNAENRRVEVYKQKQQTLRDEHNREYRTRHAAVKTELEQAVTWLDSHKTKFLVPLEKSKQEILAGIEADKIPLNPLVMSSGGQKEWIPFDITKNPEVMKLIPAEALLRERLYKGKFLAKHTFSSDDTNSVEMIFIENDGKVFHLSTVTVRGTSTDPEGSRTVHLQHSEGDSSFDVTLPTEYPQALAAVRQRSFWQNAKVVTCVPDTSSIAALSAMNDQDLVSLRYILGPTDTGMLTALEALDMDYNSLDSLLALIGASEAGKKGLSTLLNKEVIERYQQTYSAKDVAQGKSILPQRSSEELAGSSSQILSIFDQKRAPGALSTQLSVLKQKLVEFAASYVKKWEK